MRQSILREAITPLLGNGSRQHGRLQGQGPHQQNPAFSRRSVKQVKIKGRTGSGDIPLEREWTVPGSEIWRHQRSYQSHQTRRELEVAYGGKPCAVSFRQKLSCKSTTDASSTESPTVSNATSLSWACQNTTISSPMDWAVNQCFQTGGRFAAHATGGKPMKKIVQSWLRRIASSRQRPESSENGNGLPENSGHDIEYVTRIYGGGIETGVNL